MFFAWHVQKKTVRKPKQTKLKHFLNQCFKVRKLSLKVRYIYFGFTVSIWSTTAWFLNGVSYIGGITCWTRHRRRGKPQHFFSQRFSNCLAWSWLEHLKQTPIHRISFNSPHYTKDNGLLSLAACCMFWRDIRICMVLCNCKQLRPNNFSNLRGNRFVSTSIDWNWLTDS